MDARGVFPLNFPLTQPRGWLHTESAQLAAQLFGIRHEHLPPQLAAPLAALLGFFPAHEREFCLVCEHTT